MKCSMCEERLLKGTTAYSVDMSDFTVDIEKVEGTITICADCIDDFLSEFSVSFAEWFKYRYCIEHNSYVEINCFALSKSVHTRDLYDWLDDHKTLCRNLFIEELADTIEVEE